MLMLIVDTNLFHEFRPLRELPWDELGVEKEIILIVSEPVQTELDEQKKSSRARLKRRALEWCKEFRKLVLEGQTDIELRPAEPRVVLRLDGTRPSRNADDILDVSVADDEIVAVGLALGSRFSEAKVAIFSDDLRPLRKARQVSMEAIAIPEGWRRKPEQTEEDKARAQLEKELANLRRQEPELVLTSPDVNPVNYSLRTYEPLTDDQLEELLGEIQRRHPVETDFERAKNASGSGSKQALVGMFQQTFEPASHKEIALYQEELYPKWIESCRKCLGEFHLYLGIKESILDFQIELSNKGTRPADDLQIVFECKGDIALMPKSGVDIPPFIEKLEAVFALPEPPEAPQGKLSSHSAFNEFGRNSRFFFEPPRLWQLPAEFDDAIGDLRRDPNTFYPREKPDKPVTRYDLTCTQFRHADAKETFEISVLPSITGRPLDGKRALLSVVCHAANLSEPKLLNIPLRFSCERHSTYEAVRKIVFESETGVGHS